MRPASTEIHTLAISGIHAVSALLAQNRIKQLFIIESGGGGRLHEIAQTAADNNIKIIRQTRAHLDKRAGNTHHQGVIAEAHLPTGDLPALLAGDAPLVVLDGVTDPRNLGAVMRVVRAFGGAAVITPARNSAALTDAAVRAAAGAAAQIPVIRVPNISRVLRQADAAHRPIYAAAEDGTQSIYAEPLPPRLCWVLGDEGNGIRRLVREHCHTIVRIPTVDGDAGCLNISTACAICMAATRVAAE